MSYLLAKKTSFSKIRLVTDKNEFEIRLLSDTYKVDISNETIFSLSCNVPLPEHIEILILHYLHKILSCRTPGLTNEWINFRQLTGGEAYYPVFYNRAIKPILRKYGDNVKNLFHILERFPGKKSSFGDASVEILTFDNVPLLIVLWNGDEEFKSEGNILFDSSIKEIFDTEDVVILSEFVAKSI